MRYRNALENPPLLVVCDLDRIIVHTNFTGTVSATHWPADLTDEAILENLLALNQMERPMDECQRLASWALLPHDDSKVVAPYHAAAGQVSRERDL
ncbi:MAG: hypothetical protein DVB26_03885 [Verrucomicrobia bacterium]|nr:MAG: hypothetical protein DVB26_03885 [Verrucomicrobiota bacterium]